MKRVSGKLSVMKRFGFAVIVFVFLFHLSGSKAFPLSIEDEQKMGRQFADSVRKMFPVVDDDFAVQYISELGHYLLKSVETKPFPFHFYIIADNTLNAFAGPGGQVFFFTGLIEVMDNADELADVMSHEIAHVTARHLANQIEQSKKINLATLAGILAGILVGGKAAGPMMTGAMAAGMQVQLGYSRDDERQADQLGFKYSEAGGFDPAAMIQTLKKIERGQILGSDKIPSYLLTHPGGSERMTSIEIMSRSPHTPPGQDNEQATRFRKYFPLFKTILTAKYSDPDDAERGFERELEKDPQSVYANYGMGVVWREKGEYKKAISYFEEALTRQPESVLILRELAETYQLQGQYRHAVDILTKALDVDGRDKGSLYLLATCYQNLEIYSKAISIYERLKSMHPVKDEVFYNLGISYGRMNQLALAHYYFGIYFTRLAELDKARFHFQKAEALSPNDTSMKKRIEEAMKHPS